MSKDKPSRAILQMKLVQEDVDKVDKIVRHKIGVTRASRAGALREIIQQWEAVYCDRLDLQKKNQALARELRELMNMIAVQSAAAQKLQARLEDDPFFQRKFRELQDKVTVRLNQDDIELDD